MSDQFIKIRDGKINFCCLKQACKHNCCGPFSGVTKHLNNIENRPFDEIVLTQEDVDRLIRDGRYDLVEEAYSEDMKKNYYKMALETDGTCKAHRNGRCAIQGVKPTLCRAFPFYFDMFSGLCAIECEGFGEQGWTEMKELEGCFEAARKMYEFWIDFYKKTKT